MLESSARSGRTAAMTRPGLSCACQRLSEHYVFVTSSASLCCLKSMTRAQLAVWSWVLCWCGVMLRCSGRPDVVPAPPSRA